MKMEASWSTLIIITYITNKSKHKKILHSYAYRHALLVMYSD